MIHILGLTNLHIYIGLFWADKMNSYCVCHFFFAFHFNKQDDFFSPVGTVSSKVWFLWTSMVFHEIFRGQKVPENLRRSL